MWAVYKISPPGVSYIPLDFIPTNLFSNISTIPIPCLQPSLSKVSSNSIGDNSILLIFLGTPCSKYISTYSALSHASSGDWVFLYISLLC